MARLNTMQSASVAIASYEVTSHFVGHSPLGVALTACLLLFAIATGWQLAVRS